MVKTWEHLQKHEFMTHGQKHDDGLYRARLLGAPRNRVVIHDGDTDKILLQ